MVRKKTEALVVGAGPVGLFTALSLAHRGIAVEIIDQEWRKAAHSYALGLHPASIELLLGLGLAKDLVDHGYRVERIGLWQGGERQAAAEYSAVDSAFPFLLVLPQNALEGALEAALAEHQVPVRWNHALAEVETSDDHAFAVVERREKVSYGYAAATTDWIVDRLFRVETDFLIGADGIRSAVRRHLGVPFEERSPPDSYAVFEFETDWDPHGEARIAFAPDGTKSVLWPLPGGRCRVSFPLPPDAGAGERAKSRLNVHLGGLGFPYLGQSELLRLLDERMPWFTGGVKDVRWSIVVRFEKRLAGGFGTGRVWLAGDSAHVANPMGLASMNLGLREGDDLSRRIHEVLRGGVAPSRLAEYDVRAREEWGRLLSPGAGYAASPAATEFVRARAADLGALLPASGAHLDALARSIGLVREAG